MGSMIERGDAGQSKILTLRASERSAGNDSLSYAIVLRKCPMDPIEEQEEDGFCSVFSCQGKQIAAKNKVSWTKNSQMMSRYLFGNTQVLYVQTTFH